MPRDLRYEAWLDEQGVQWSFKEQEPLDSINRSWSALNAGRVGRRIDPDVVEEYAIAMNDGAVFPPLICYEDRVKGRYTVSGNHRLGAADKANVDTFDMYIVQPTDEYVVERMLASANVIEGTRPSRDQLVKSGIELVLKFDATIKEVADALKLPYSVLERAVQYKQSQQRMIDVGVEPKRLNTTAVHRLGAIPNDRALAAAAHLIQETRLPTESINKLVVDVRKAKTEDDQLRVVNEWANRPEVATRRAQTRRGRDRVQQTTRSELFRHLNGLDGLLRRCATLSQLQITSDDDRQKAWRLWLGIERQMKEKFSAGNSGTILPYRPSETA